jgi:carbon storage regulator
MLVLTRRTGEEIVIDNNIRVTILEAGPNKVRIGITAPPDVAVDRSEIHALKLTAAQDALLGRKLATCS